MEYNYRRGYNDGTRDERQRIIEFLRTVPDDGLWDIEDIIELMEEDTK